MQSESNNQKDQKAPAHNEQPANADQEAVKDLLAPQWYLNRELSWLAFNRRVLNESVDERNPLLERVNFLSIIGSNLDEFFMKRIGGLKQQVGARVKQLSTDGRMESNPGPDFRLQNKDMVAVIGSNQARASFNALLVEEASPETPEPVIA